MYISDSDATEYACKYDFQDRNGEKKKPQQTKTV